MNLNSLRYTNIPRKLDAAGDRDPAARPRTYEVVLAHTWKTSVTFTGTMASAKFQKSLRRLEGVPDPEGQQDTDQNTPVAGSQAVTRRQIAGCAVCKKGHVNPLKHQLKQFRARNFVGCRAGKQVSTSRLVVPR